MRTLGRWLIGLGLGGLLVCVSAEGQTLAPSMPYPQSIPSHIEELLAAYSQKPKDPLIVTQLAGLYLHLGDDLYSDDDQRLMAYERGAQLALEALELKEDQADAHFYYAANLGKMVQLQGIIASALMVGDIEIHAHRALEIEDDHASALHMMGMLYEELPWFLGGDSDEALKYLRRAVSVDGSYLHARLDLAKAYIKRDRFEEAKKELRAIQENPHPRSPYAWTHRYKPEASRLLEELKNP